MGTEDEHQHQHTAEDRLNEPEQSEQGETTAALPTETVVHSIIPDIPVVRSNTPRPFSFRLLTTQDGQQQVPPMSAEMLATFPREAPSAPPVPEEVNEQGADTRDDDHNDSDEVGGSTPLPLAPGVVADGETAPEFVWLFEYGLEMDSSVLNRPERLHDLALLYGPAVLKGYQLAFAVEESRRKRVVATIVPSSIPDSEVWGIVYRIPRRLMESLDGAPARLDLAHDAVPPDSLFERAHVIVYETYRGRELSCVTYVALPSAHPQMSSAPDAALAQRLLNTIRKHQLPDDYAPTVLFASDTSNDGTTGQSSVQVSSLSPASAVRTEQNTEPLPVVLERPDTPLPEAGPRDAATPSVAHSTSYVGLTAFACYLVALLLGALALAVVQGLGVAGNVFTVSFTPLSVPWYILVYGLIGGSIGCLVMLGRQRVTQLPVYALMAWYMRPLIGCVLAMMAYLLLNSGLFAFMANTGQNAGQHVMLFSLLSSIAGYCEGWLFFRRGSN